MSEKIIFDVGGWPTASGAQNPRIFLDPENGRVYTFGCIGSGSPAKAYHGIHRTLGQVPVDADPDSVRDLLQAQESKILGIQERYLGTEWDGHNHVGKWEDDDREDFEEQLDLEGVATFWDASDFFYADPDTVLGELLKAESLESYVDAEIESAAGQQVLLKRSDCLETLRQLLTEEIERLNDDEGDDLVAYRALLGEQDNG